MTLATCFLTETNVAELEELIAQKAWNKLRIYVSDLAESYEVRLMVNNNQADKLEEWLMIEEMNDIATDIAIQMHEVNDEQPKFRRRIIRSQEST